LGCKWDYRDSGSLKMLDVENQIFLSNSHKGHIIKGTGGLIYGIWDPIYLANK